MRVQLPDRVMLKRLIGTGNKELDVADPGISVAFVFAISSCYYLHGKVILLIPPAYLIIDTIV